MSEFIYCDSRDQKRAFVNDNLSKSLWLQLPYVINGMLEFPINNRLNTDQMRTLLNLADFFDNTFAKEQLNCSKNGVWDLNYCNVYLTPERRWMDYSSQWGTFIVLKFEYDNTPEKKYGVDLWGREVKSDNRFSRAGKNLEFIIDKNGYMGYSRDNAGNACTETSKEFMEDVVLWSIMNKDNWPVKKDNYDNTSIW